MIPHYNICLKMLRPFTKWGDKPRRENSKNCYLGTESKYSYVDEWPRALGTKCLNLPKENPEAKVFTNYIQSVVTHVGLWTNACYPKPPARFGGWIEALPFVGFTNGMCFAFDSVARVRPKLIMFMPDMAALSNCLGMVFVHWSVYSPILSEHIIYWLLI